MAGAGGDRGGHLRGVRVTCTWRLENERERWSEKGRGREGAS